jgi:hypothetical protein
MTQTKPLRPSNLAIPPSTSPSTQYLIPTDLHHLKSDWTERDPGIQGLPQKWLRLSGDSNTLCSNPSTNKQTDTILDRQNCNDRKKHNGKPLPSPFRGPRGQEVIFEVAEAKFWISSIFNEFSFRIFVVLGFEVV